MGTYSISSGSKLYLNYATASEPTWANISGAGTLELNSAQAANGTAFWTWTHLSLPLSFTGTLQVDNGRIVGSPSNLGGTSNLVLNSNSQFLAFDGTMDGNSYTYPQTLSLSGMGWGESGYQEGVVRVAGMSATFSGSITLNGNTGFFTQDYPNSTITVSSSISGAYAVTCTARNNFITFTGANTYTGATTINFGTFKAGNNSALGTSATGTSISSGATFDINGYNFGQEEFTLAGGSLVNNGAPSWNTMQKLTVTANSTIGGTNNWSISYSGMAGSFTINSGVTVTKTGNNFIQLLWLPLTNNGSFLINAGSFGIQGYDAWGAGNITLTSGTTLDIASWGNSTVIYPPIISNGGSINCSQSDGSNFVVLAGSVTLNNATTITTNSCDFSISGIISGTGSLTKNGAGTLTLSGANTYTGTTTINSGTVILQNTYSSPSYSIASGAVLELNRTVYTDYTTSTTFSGAGTLRKTGSGQVLWGLSAATFALSAGSLIDVQAGNVSGSSSGNEVWTNNYSGLTVASGAIFQGVEGSVKVDALNGAGTVTSGWLGTGSITVGINNGSGTFSGVIGDFDLASGHTGSIIKVGTGTQSLSGANTFTRGVTLNAGQLNINSTSALGSGTFTIANGTSIDNTSGGSISLSTNNVQIWNGDFTFIGTNPLNLGTGTVTMGTTLRTVTTTASTLTVGGTISGSGGLTKAGAGTITLGGISLSNWTGPTTISAGRFNLGTQGGGDYYASTAWTINSGATLFQSSANIISNSAIVTVNNGGIWDLNGKSECVGYIAGSGSISNTGGLLQLDLPAIGTGSEFLGVISGSAQLKVRGNITAGKQILSGLNTYTGSTVIANGTLSINSIQDVSGGASAVGAPTTIANGTIQLGATTTTGILEYTGTGNITDRVIDLSGTTGGGAITQSGTGLLKFTSALTATGIGVKTVTLQGSSAGTGEIAGTIVDGSGTTAIIKSGTGTWTLSGANTFTGLTTINNGIIKLGSSTALGSIAAGTFVNDGSALDFNGQTYLNNEALTIYGSGVSNSGVLFNSGSSASFPGPISLASASTISANNQITLSGTISNNQHFTKTGTNSLVFSNNTVTVNNLAISDGTLDGASSTVNVYGNFTSSGTFIPNSNGIVLLGSSIQTIPAVSFNNLTINNATGANLAGNISVAGTLTLTSGILNTGVYTVDLGTNGSIVEATPSITAPTSYVTGTVLATRNIGSSTNNTFGGIGVEINETHASNSTKVTRVTGTACSGNGKIGIKRYFTIVPTTDVSLNGTMVFRYFDSELNGSIEANLDIYKSTDNRVHWDLQNAILDATNNKLTLTGISSFSDWTASDAVNNNLPIELKTFTVKKYSEKVGLLWITASETNNDLFTLERSNDGSSWTSIYLCNGAGTSTQEHQYSFTDNNPSFGMNYYRLKQTDFNGNFTFSDIKSVRFTNDSISMQIYPIPAKAEQITLFVSSVKTGLATIAVFDLLGQQICNGEIELGSSPFKLQFSDICTVIPGTYYVIISNNDMMVRNKIVVE